MPELIKFLEMRFFFFSVKHLSIPANVKSTIVKAKFEINSFKRSKT